MRVRAELAQMVWSVFPDSVAKCFLANNSVLSILTF